MKKKTVKEVIEMSTKEYVEQYNSTHKDQITRYDVYDLIKQNKLKAHKGYRGAWVIELEKPENKKPCKCKNCKCDKKVYSTKEFVEAYNKKHPKATITVKELRYLIEAGEVKAKKVSGKWQVSADPRLRIK